MKSGIELISAERERQINQEGWTEAHDDEHTDGSLALAAVCYATPVLIRQEDRRANCVGYSDPWPWDGKYDKRYTFKGGNELPSPQFYSSAKRLDLLVKAGGLIAAEIDRLQRAGQP